ELIFFVPVALGFTVQNVNFVLFMAMPCKRKNVMRGACRCVYSTGHTGWTTRKNESTENKSYHHLSSSCCDAYSGCGAD
ncbi:MAG: hypothetical protein K2L62_04660, partial [Muribaculaceae bacterium]|nr:hypothetical protein [Muribaculaceae bacterium]